MSEAPPYDIHIVNRTDLIRKESKRRSADQVRAKQNEGNKWNPVTWIKRTGRKLSEQYHNKTGAERLRKAMLENNNAFLETDLVTGAIKNADANREAFKLESEAKIAQIKLQQKINIEFDDIAIATDRVKGLLVDEVILPLADQLKDPSSPLKGNDEAIDKLVQEKMQAFVKGHLRDRKLDRNSRAQLAKLFGSKATKFGVAAESFATNIPELIQKIADDKAAHVPDEEIAKKINITLTNSEWGASTEEHLSAIDRGLTWVQSTRFGGYFLNEATVGALSSFAMAAGTVALRSGSRAAGIALAPFTGLASLAGGAIGGGIVAGLERRRNLLQDRAAQHIHAELGGRTPPSAERRRQMGLYDIASVDDILRFDNLRYTSSGDTRSMETLLSKPITSDRDAEALADRVAEIYVRLRLSHDRKIGLIREGIMTRERNGKFELMDKMFAGGEKLTEYYKNRDGLTNEEAFAMHTDAVRKQGVEWQKHFTKDKKDQDKDFNRYLLVSSAKHAGIGGIIGLLSGSLGQQGFAEVMRATGHQTGTTVLEQGVTATKQHFLENGGHAAAAAASADLQHANLAASVRPDVHADISTTPDPTLLENVHYPPDTMWVQEPNNGGWDLVKLSNHKDVLIKGARIDPTGQITADHVSNQVHVNLHEGSVTTQEKSWGDLSTHIDRTEWYGKGQGFHTVKIDDHTIRLELRDVPTSQVQGDKVFFSAIVPGHEQPLVFSADHYDPSTNVASVTLDLNDTTNAVQLGNGGTIHTGDIARSLVNKDALANLATGDSGTEYGHMDVFNVAANGKNGFLTAGSLITNPDGSNTWQTFGTIHGASQVHDAINVTTTTPPSVDITESTVAAPGTQPVPRPSGYNGPHSSVHPFAGEPLKPRPNMFDFAHLSETNIPNPLSLDTLAAVQPILDSTVSGVSLDPFRYPLENVNQDTMANTIPVAPTTSPDTQPNNQTLESSIKPGIVFTNADNGKQFRVSDIRGDTASIIDLENGYRQDVPLTEIERRLSNKSILREAPFIERIYDKLQQTQDPKTSVWLGTDGGLQGFLTDYLQIPNGKIDIVPDEDLLKFALVIRNNIDHVDYPDLTALLTVRNGKLHAEIDPDQNLSHGDAAWISQTMHSLRTIQSAIERNIPHQWKVANFEFFDTNHGDTLEINFAKRAAGGRVLSHIRRELTARR